MYKKGLSPFKIDSYYYDYYEIRAERNQYDYYFEYHQYYGDACSYLLNTETLHVFDLEGIDLFIDGIPILKWTDDEKYLAIIQVGDWRDYREGKPANHKIIIIDTESSSLISTDIPDNFYTIGWYDNHTLSYVTSKLEVFLYDIELKKRSKCFLQTTPLQLYNEIVK